MWRLWCSLVFLSLMALFHGVASLLLCLDGHFALAILASLVGSLHLLLAREVWLSIQFWNLRS